MRSMMLLRSQFDARDHRGERRRHGSARESLSLIRASAIGAAWRKL
jgi:hypothetical protein